MNLPLAQAGSFFANGGGLFAAGVAAVSIPIAIHMLTRLQRVHVPWGAMKFLMEVYKRHRTRLQLEQLILLAVRCLILAMLGFALAGPRPKGVAQGLGLDGGQRMVCLVLDDSLSSRALAGGKARFEELRELAVDLIDGLDPSDRIAIWSAAQPTREILVPAVMDRSGARNAIQSMQPRFTRSDLPATLQTVAGFLSKQNEPKEQVYVAVLSDFAEDALPTDAQPTAEVTRIGKFAAKLLIAPRLDSLPNAQVAVIKPRRHMLVVSADQVAPSIPLSVKLRRFVEDETTIQTTKLNLFVYDYDANLASNPGGSGQSATPLLGPITREWKWSPGQQTGGWDNFELPLEGLREALGDGFDVGSLGGGPGTGRRLVIKATIDDDALGEDNERTAVVELRSKLSVGLIDQSFAQNNDDNNKLRPAQWMQLVLRVGRNHVQQVPATDIDSKVIQTLDAAVVLRPDLLGEPDWKQLRALADRGGMVWVFAPTETADAQWGDRFVRSMSLDWQIGLEAKKVDALKHPAGIGLATDTAIPEALNLLAADWSDLLRPLRLNQWMPVAIKGGDDRVWARLSGDAIKADTVKGDDGPDNNFAGGQPDANIAGPPLIVASGVGDGVVCFVATAVDPAWSNLPTKPLFVPLINEGLRGVLGSSGEGSRLARVMAGDKPFLGKGWDGAQRLVRVDGVKSGSRRAVPLQRTDEGFVPIQSLEEPGVYLAVPDVAGRKLSVNVEPVAGSTRTVDEDRLKDWLNSLGTWDMIDRDAPTAGLSEEIARANIGWHMLWIVMALVIIELLLARWFSHAKEETQKPRFNRILGQVLGSDAVTRGTSGGSGAGSKGGAS